MAQRVGRYLERQGLLERDTGNIYLTQEAVDTSSVLNGGRSEFCVNVLAGLAGLFSGILI